MKKKIIAFSLFFASTLFVIGYIFWVTEVQFITPTEIPNNYVKVKVMDTINLASVLGASNGKPTFLHYYNPYCPCSKFNYNYYQSLVEKYEKDFNMYLVIREMDSDVLEDIEETITVKTTLIIDKGGKIAKETGVYATPQAVLLNPDHTLYYRGNYNRTRYCTVENSNYAEMAMDSLLMDRPSPDFGYFAETAYGCSLEKEREFYQVLLNIY
ncbi:MAG: redoxin domain-containing protein [Cyclobacteriaceae bacterium]|nr:redoxin domain-containing protein [Cyclobacteriaceae bacterium]